MSRRSSWSSAMPMTVAAVLALTTTGAAPLSAQDTREIEPRFQPWIGCWRAMDSGVGLEELDGGGQPTRACVVPSATRRGSVDIALFRRDSLLSRSAVPIPGTSVAKSLDDCEGTESSQWSSDGRRLILKAELVCAQGIKRVETGLMTMSPAGQWVQLQHIKVGTNEGTFAARFRFEGDSVMPAGLSVGSQRSSRALRLNAGAPITAEAVTSVATAVPASLAEAWLAESGQQFKLDAPTLLALADGGVPPRVIDVMVALANPAKYRVGPAGGAGGAYGGGYGAAPAQIVAEQGDRTGRRGNRCAMMDDLCYGPGGFGAWGFGYGFDRWGNNLWLNSPWAFRNSWRYSPFGLGWGDPWSPWGWNGGGVYYGGGPVVIVPTNPGSGSGNPQVRGRAVNGGGYTRASDPYMGGTAPRGTVSSPSGSGGGSVGGGGGVSGGGGDGGRTAKPRPPL